MVWMFDSVSWAQTTNTAGPNIESLTRIPGAFPTNTHFGLVVSEPVRLRVIKE